jgi:hypothetical protein
VTARLLAPVSDQLASSSGWPTSSIATASIAVIVSGRGLDILANGIGPMDDETALHFDPGVYAVSVRATIA